MSIDADTGLQIDPDENIPRLDVSGVADVIGYTDFDNFNMPIGSGLFDESGNVNLDFISSLINDPAIFNAFTEFDPEAAAELRRLVGGGGNTRSFGGGQSGIATLDLGNVGGASTAGRDEVELAGPNYGDPNTILKQDDIDLQNGPNYGDPNKILEQNDIDLQEGTTSKLLTSDGDLTSTGTSALTGEGIIADAAANKISDELGSDTDKITSLTQDPADVATAGVTTDKIGTTTNKTGTTTNKTDTTGTNKGLSSLSDLLKYFLPALASYLSYKSAKDAQEQARGVSFSDKGPTTATRTTYKGSRYSAAQGGVMSLAEGGQILNEEIKNYITNVLGNNKSQQEQAAEINAAAQQYNVGRDRIASATGYDLNTVNQFLGPNIIGQKTAATPYQIYDKESDTYRYVDAAEYEKWLSGIPLTPINRVQGSPVYYGASPTAKGDYDIGISPLGDLAPRLNVLDELDEDKTDDLEETLKYKLPLPDLTEVNLKDPKSLANFIKKQGEKDPEFIKGFFNSLEELKKQTQPFGPNSYSDVDVGIFRNPRVGYEINDAAYSLYSDPKKSNDFINLLKTYSGYAAGGMTTRQPFYLGGPTDGMADEVPAHIDNKRPAALSDGEFVIPADVVSHLGNGNSNAGAKRLYEMMDRIREARTGNSEQGIQINPNNFMPG